MVAKHFTISFLIKFGHVVLYIYIYIYLTKIIFVVIY